MKVVLAFVASLDGRVTGPNGEQSREWASPEDQNFFSELVQSIGVVVMGRNTYEAHKDFFTASPHIRRIVMTSSAELPKNAAPGIEVSSTSPKELIRKLEDEGIHTVLLAAGPRLSAAFLKVKLVSDFYLTLEPFVFGGGLAMFEGDVGTPQLSLVSTEKLNARGTILSHYSISY